MKSKTACMLTALCVSMGGGCSKSTNQSASEGPAPSNSTVTAPPSSNAGAGGQTSGGGASRSAALSWFEPSDLTTALESPLLRFGVDNNEAQLDRELAAKLASSLSVRRYPDMTPIPAMIEAYAPGQWQPSEKRNLFDVRPTTPLGAGWYVLRLDLTALGQWSASRFAPGLSWQPGQFVKLSDGSIGSRFRVGSQPVVRSITFCPKGGTTWSIITEFSERVVAEGIERVASARHIPVGSERCTEVRDNGGREPSFKEVTLSCSALDAGLQIEITLSAAVRSAGGTALSATPGQTELGFDGNGARFTGRISALSNQTHHGNGCRSLWPEPSLTLTATTTDPVRR